MLRLSTRDGSRPEPQEGVLRLSAERTWVVQGEPGDEELLAEVSGHLRADVCERVGRWSLRLHFGNAVGSYDLPHLDPIQVYSGKWGEPSFDEMLAQISARIAALPFAAGTGGGLPYDRSIRTDRRVLYHAFVYLRSVLSGSAPRGARLDLALRVVLAEPHRRLERFNRVVPVFRARRIGPRTLRHVLGQEARLQRAPPGVAPALAHALHGHLPERVEETAVRSTVDVPENRFVKMFLAQALGIVEEVQEIATQVGGPFAARVGADCAHMMRLLVPVRRAGIWEEISDMKRLPVESTVLQRQRGYREIFRHFIRMRMSVRIPVDPTDDLLELKDIATLFELWSFFEVEQAVTAVLGEPSVAISAQTGKLQKHLPFGLRVAWEDGTELFYNLTYSRSRKQRRSYSLTLRPDVVLRAASGGVSAFDAKFRLRRIEDVARDSEEVDEGEVARERRGVFKSADLYKMHTYRDALSIPSVWILYPGDDFRFFEARPPGRIVQACGDLTSPLDGVGAIPLRPGDEAPELRHVVRSLLLRHGQPCDR